MHGYKLILLQGKFNNKLKFNLQVSDIKERTKEIMDQTKKVLDEVAVIPVGSHTFENTIKRIADQEAVQSVNSANVTFPSYPAVISFF